MAHKHGVLTLSAAIALLAGAANSGCSRRVEKRPGSLGITVNLPPLPPEYRTGNWVTNLFAETPEATAVAIALKITNEAGKTIATENLKLTSPYLNLELYDGIYTAEAEVWANAVVGGKSALCTTTGANKPQLAATTKQTFKVDATSGNVTLDILEFETPATQKNAYIKLNGDTSNIAGYTFLHALTGKPMLNACATTDGSAYPHFVFPLSSSGISLPNFSIFSASPLTVALVLSSGNTQPIGTLAELQSTTSLAKLDVQTKTLTTAGLENDDFDSDGISNINEISAGQNPLIANGAPTISDVPNQTTSVDTALNNVAVTIHDADSTIACGTSLTATSSNTTVLPTANITIGGTAPNCTVSMNPAAGIFGNSTVTLTLTDGVLTAQDTFVFTVNNAPTMAAISTPQTTNEDTAKGVAFTISDIESPLPCSDASLTYTSDNSALVLNNGAAVVWTGTYPTCTGTISLVPNASGSANITFQVSDGLLTASRTFALSVIAQNDIPIISDVSNQSTNEDIAPSNVSFWVSDAESTLTCAGSVTASSSNTVLLPNGNISIGGTAPNCTLSMSPVADENGSSTVTLSVTDGSLTAQDTFVLTVVSINDAPTISDVANLTTHSGSPLNNIAVTISDVDHALACASALTGTSNDTTLLPNENITFAGVSPNCTVSLTPAANQSGNAVVTLTVSDGSLSAQDTFALNVIPGWFQEAYIKASNSNASDFFGTRVSLSGDTLAVGATGEASTQGTITNGTTSSTLNSYSGSGAVYVYKRVGSSWDQQAYIKASNRGMYEYFGSSVSLSGDVLTVGAHSEDSNQTTITNGASSSGDSSSSGSGAVYVYKRTGSTWAQEAYVKAANAASNAYFGCSMSLSGDTLAVGAHAEASSQTTVTNGTVAAVDIQSATSGAVYIYKRTGSTWAQEAYVKAANNSAADGFGSSVALSGDSLAVGAYQEDSNQTDITNGTAASADNSVSNSGAVYIYKRTGKAWVQEAYVKAVNGNSTDSFGTRVSLSGNTLAVGATGEASNQTIITNDATASANNSNSASGAVYIYKRTDSTWVQEAYVKAANNNATDNFGASVSLSGNTLAIGATGEDSNQTIITTGTAASGDNSKLSAGAVYIYKRSGSSWTQNAYVKAVNAAAFASFGASVSLSGDTLAVGATGESSSQSTITNGTDADFNTTNSSAGAVYVYRNTEQLFDPPELIATSINTTSFDVSWRAATLGAGNGTYKVVYGTTEPAANCASGTVAYTGTNTSVTASSGVVAGNTYFVRVCTTNGVTWSEGAVARVTVKGDSSGPSITSITRGAAANPVAFGTPLIDYVVTFSEPVIGVMWWNFTLTEIGTATGAAGDVESINCTGGSVCTVWVVPANAGNLRLDSSSTTGISDVWGNALGATRVGDEYYTLVGGSGWYQEAYIKAANANAADYFGTSVALSSDTLAVGATGEDSGQTTITNGTTASTLNSYSYSGAVYVYKRTGSTWLQEAYVKASNNIGSNYFGTSVSLSDNTLAVGAHYESSAQTTITNGTTASFQNSNSSSGAVYVYKRTGATWNQEAYVKASNNGASDYFGLSVSLVGDTLAVGAYYESSNQTTISSGANASGDDSSSYAGAVYVFQRTANMWAQQAFIKSSNSNSSDYFGYQVSLSGDALAVGAFGESSNQTTITNGTTASLDNSSSYSGAVYVYKRTGNAWAQEAYIKAANNNSGDYFGDAVSLSGDTLAVGAYAEDSNQNTITNGGTASIDNLNSSAGAVYVYKRTGTSWAQEAYVKAVNSEASDSFGHTLSLSGNTLVVSSPGEDSKQTIILNGTSASANGWNSNSGAVYVYKRTATTWVQDAYLKASNNNASDGFGASVSLSGDTIAVGATGEDSNQTTITNDNAASSNNSTSDAGAVYVYRNAGRLFEAPESFTASADTTSFTATWGAAPLGTGNGSYKVVYGTTEPAANCASGTVAYTGTNTTASVASGVVAGTTYYVRICTTTNGSTWSEGVVNRVVVRAESTIPTVTSIVRGSAANPVPFGTALIDYVLTFSEPVVGLAPSNLTLTEFATATGATGEIDSIDCSAGSSCRVWVVPANAGNLQLDVSSTTGVSDPSGNALATTRTGDEYYTLVGGSGWYQEAYLKASNANASDYFGYSVSLSGNTLAIGAPGESGAQVTITNGTDASSSNSYSSSGAVYVYTRTGSTWVQEAYVKAANANSSDYFGSSVALSGNTLAVGAPSEDSNQAIISNGPIASLDNSYFSSGAVYVYNRTASTWAQEAYVKTENNNSYDYFGSAVSLSGDTLAVGAYGEASNQTTITNGSTASFDNLNSSSGAVYVYRRTGTTWAQEAYVKAVNSNASDYFGLAVSLFADTLVAGAKGEDSYQVTITNGTIASTDNSGSSNGAVYVYKRTGNTWEQEAYVKATNSNSYDYFGNSGSLSGDTLAVGAYGESSNQTTITNGTTASGDNSISSAGAVYIYKRTGSTWVPEAYVKAANSNGGDSFGYSISLSGNALVVGAYGEDSKQTIILNGTNASINNWSSGSGAAYVYKRTGTVWSQDGYVKALNNNAGDSFGASVSLSGDTLAVGAKDEDSNQTTITNGTTASADNSNSNSGAVYVYRNTNRLFDPDVRVSAKTQTSITFAWTANLGTSTTVKVAPAALGTGTAAIDCSGGTVLNAGDTTYTYPGLTAGTKYGFRFCAWDGTNASGGSTIWEETSP